MSFLRACFLFSLIFSVLEDMLYCSSPAAGMSRNNKLGQIMAKFNVPNQKYLRIGDVSRLLGVKPSVIRFWETQFSQLTPKKTRRGQRIFSPEDVQLLKIIQRELKETGMTIDGLRKKMAQQSGDKKPESDIKMETLLQIRNELQGILDFLKTNG